MDEATFRKMHAADKMASDKLDEGIAGFHEGARRPREAARRAPRGSYGSPERATAKGEAAQKLFKVYDMDGDGFITREEWGGADAVFDALDLDRDGRITPEELAAGLGAAFRLQA